MPGSRRRQKHSTLLHPETSTLSDWFPYEVSPQNIMGSTRLRKCASYRGQAETLYPSKPNIPGNSLLVEHTSLPVEFDGKLFVLVYELTYMLRVATKNPVRPCLLTIDFNKLAVDGNLGFNCRAKSGGFHYSQHSNSGRFPLEL